MGLLHLIGILIGIYAACSLAVRAVEFAARTGWMGGKIFRWVWMAAAVACIFSSCVVVLLTFVIILEPASRQKQPRDIIGVFR